jgi:hypothetical protein
MVLIVDYCKTGHIFEVARKDRLCLNDRVHEILHFKCKLCDKTTYSELQEKELDWEGLR